MTLKTHRKVAMFHASNRKAVQSAQSQGYGVGHRGPNLLPGMRGAGQGRRFGTGIPDDLKRSARLPGARGHRFAGIHEKEKIIYPCGQWEDGKIMYCEETVDVVPGFDFITTRKYFRGKPRRRSLSAGGHKGPAEKCAHITDKNEWLDCISGTGKYSSGGSQKSKAPTRGSGKRKSRRGSSRRGSSRRGSSRRRR